MLPWHRFFWLSSARCGAGLPNQPLLHLHDCNVAALHLKIDPYCTRRPSKLIDAEEKNRENPSKKPNQEKNQNNKKNSKKNKHFKRRKKKGVCQEIIHHVFLI